MSTRQFLKPKSFIYVFAGSLFFVGLAFLVTVLVTNTNIRRANGNNDCSQRRLFIESQSAYNKGSNVITINSPRGDTAPGDLIILFLSRTDDVLPIKLDNWTLGASCFKRINSQRRCRTVDDCVVRSEDGRFCYKFNKGARGGRDLATVVYYKAAEENEPSEYVIDVGGQGRAAWAIVTAIEGVNMNRPIRSVNYTSCDKTTNSTFPSVYGKLGDTLLLSLAFDDRAELNEFESPPGTELVNWIQGKDETGFLYTKTLDKKGETGQLVTLGPGGHYCKDAMISLVLRMNRTRRGDTDTTVVSNTTSNENATNTTNMTTNIFSPTETIHETIYSYGEFQGNKVTKPGCRR